MVISNRLQTIESTFYLTSSYNYYGQPPYQEQNMTSYLEPPYQEQNIVDRMGAIHVDHAYSHKQRLDNYITSKNREKPNPVPVLDYS